MIFNRGNIEGTFVEKLPDVLGITCVVFCVCICRDWFCGFL